MEQSVDPHGTDAVVSLQAAADGSLRGTIVNGARVQNVACTATRATPHAR
jgi:hypothetical protein